MYSYITQQCLVLILLITFCRPYAVSKQQLLTESTTRNHSYKTFQEAGAVPSDHTQGHINQDFPLTSTPWEEQHVTRNKQVTLNSLPITGQGHTRINSVDRYVPDGSNTAQGNNIGHTSSKKNSHNELSKSVSKPVLQPTTRNNPSLRNNLTTTEVLAKNESVVTTVMVYVANAATTGASVAIPGNFESLNFNIQFRVKDVALAICGTIACMLTLCMLVTFTRCCCKKPKEQEDEEQGNVPAAGTTRNTFSWWRRKPSKSVSTSAVHTQPSSVDRVTQAAIEPQVTPENDDDEYSGSKNRAPQRDPKKLSTSSLPALDSDEAVSVRDRIKVFEKQKYDKSHVKLRDGSKPRRKKPKSRAFEEFESQGILIGFGNGGHKRASEDGEEGQEEERVFPDGDGQRAVLPPFHLPAPGDLNKQSTNDRFSPTPRSLDDDEGVATMDSEEDEFAAVQRNSEILKSFRRAPPPKNRSRARRSGRQQGNARESKNLKSNSNRIEEESGTDRRSPSAADCDQFERSLHMPTQPTPQNSMNNVLPVLKTKSISVSGGISDHNNDHALDGARSRMDPNNMESDYEPVGSIYAQPQPVRGLMVDEMWKPPRPATYHESGQRIPTPEQRLASSGLYCEEYEPDIVDQQRPRANTDGHSIVTRNASSPRSRAGTGEDGANSSRGIKRWGSENIPHRGLSLATRGHPGSQEETEGKLPGMKSDSYDTPTQENDKQPKI